MKTCPYCAEEIKDAAIVCRYCGRDLIESDNARPTATNAPSTPIQKQLPSSWSQGAKVSSVLTILAALGQLLRYPNAPVGNIIGEVLIGTIVNFFVWWLLATGCIALWRKGRKVFFLVVSGIILIVVTLAISLGISPLSDNSTAILAIHTPTVTPSATLSPAQSLRLTTIANSESIEQTATASRQEQVSFATSWAKEIKLSDCIPWYQINSSYVGRDVCVTGTVLKTDYSIYVGCYYYFGGNPQDFYAEAYFGCGRVKTGDCISGIGVVRTNKNGVLFIGFKSFVFCN